MEIESEVLSKQVVKKPNDDAISAQVSEAKEEEKVYLCACGQILWSLMAMGSYIVDIGSDVFVAYTHSVEGHWWWFAITLGFVVVSSLTINVTSFCLYWSGRKEIKTSRAKWMLLIVLHVLQLGPVVRYAYNIWYGHQSRRAVKSKSAEERDYWNEMKANVGFYSTFLRLLECYMEAAPQLTLQLYIIMHPDYGFSKTVYFAVGQVVGCVSSVVSIACSLTFVYTTLHNLFQDKTKSHTKMTNRASIVMFAWRFCSVSARILAFALFASYFPFWIISVYAIHVVVVFVWIRCQQTTLVVSRAFDVFLLAVMALLNMFDYVDIKLITDGHTRLRYLLFYILIFVENLAMTLAIFLVPSQIATPSYLYWVMISILALHVSGIAIQVAYYLRFHPNNDPESGKNRIQLWIPCTTLLKECCP